jgi:hypothetical protein
LVQSYRSSFFEWRVREVSQWAYIVR